MPYVITTTPRCPNHDAGAVEIGAECLCGEVFTRRAVATLDDAADACWAIMDEQPRYFVADAARLGDQIRALADSGGTVGPLPDGTTITVEPIGREALASEGGYPRAAFVSTDDLVASVNAVFARKEGRS